jgi:hypothetical protein
MMIEEDTPLTLTQIVDCSLSSNEIDHIPALLEEGYQHLRRRVADARLVPLSTTQTANTYTRLGESRICYTIMAHVITEERLQTEQRKAALRGIPGGGGFKGAA